MRSMCSYLCNLCAHIFFVPCLLIDNKYGMKIFLSLYMLDTISIYTFYLFSNSYAIILFGKFKLKIVLH